jgi:uncharacterized CHY-type Zn-finger protein
MIKPSYWILCPVCEENGINIEEYHEHGMCKKCREEK